MQIRFTLRRMQYNMAQVLYEADSLRLVKENARWAEICIIMPRCNQCNQSLFSGMDSSQHPSLHQAFRSLLTDRTNV